MGKEHKPKTADQSVEQVNPYKGFYTANDNFIEVAQLDENIDNALEEISPALPTPPDPPRPQLERPSANSAEPDSVAMGELPDATAEEPTLTLEWQSPAQQGSDAVLPDSPLMHEASIDDSSYAAPPSQSRVDFTLTDGSGHDFSYLDSSLWSQYGRGSGFGEDEEAGDNLLGMSGSYYPDVNDAPIANPDNLVAREDNPISLDILSNDYDEDGDTLEITSITDAVDTSTGEIIGTTDIEDGEVIFTPDPSYEGEVSFNYAISDGEYSSSTTTTVTVEAVADPLDAQESQVGYVDGVYKLNIDFSEYFPEQDGTEYYEGLTLSGLSSLPDGAKLIIDATTTLWSSGDGDTLTLSAAQAAGLESIYLTSANAGDFTISVDTLTTERSNHDQAMGAGELSFSILDRPELATYEINSTDADRPDVFWYQTGDATDVFMVYDGGLYDYDYDSMAPLLTYANSPLLINNNPDLYQGNGTVVIDNVDYNGDSGNTLTIQGFSTELNGSPTGNINDEGNPILDGSSAAYLTWDRAHSATFDYTNLTWSLDDIGSELRIDSPHLRQQFGDQSMQILSQNVQNGINFFEAQSVIMGYMNESCFLLESQQLWEDFVGFEMLMHPDYLQAGWDDRIFFGTNDANDTLMGEDSDGGGAKNNILVGFGGDDTLIYGEGNDNLFGGDGDDKLIIDTEFHNGFMDAYDLTDYVIPTGEPWLMNPGEYAHHTVAEGKIDGGDGYDVLYMGEQADIAGQNTLYLNYAEHYFGSEPKHEWPDHYYGKNEDFFEFWVEIDGYTIGTETTGFKYHMLNIEEIDITGDADDANTLNLNQDNVWLITSNDYDKTLYITGDDNDRLEIRDQQNWHYMGSDDEHAHYVSANGLSDIYVDNDITIVATGNWNDQAYSGVRVNGESELLPRNDNVDDTITVEEGFTKVEAAGGDDTITLSLHMENDGTINPIDFDYIDGGSGNDVLQLQHILGAPDMGTHLDLTALDNSKITNIETIDISGDINDANTLTLDISDVLDMTDENNTLTIIGDANDTVNCADPDAINLWQDEGSTEIDGTTYSHYSAWDDTSSSYAHVYMSPELQLGLG